MQSVIKTVAMGTLKKSLSLLFIFVMYAVVKAQEVTVIDHKGTLVNVTNNLVTTSATTPLVPLSNDIWFDTTTNITKVYDGTQWLEIDPDAVTTAATAPAVPVIGDIWFDDTNASNIETYVWDGSSWVEIAHRGTTGSVFFAGADGKATEDNSAFFWNNTAKSLFIGGILSGTHKLYVNGSTRTLGISNDNGTAGTPSYTFTDDPDTGMYRTAANELAFSTQGTEALHIDNLQRVGIGIGAPDESLHIANNMRLNGAFEDKDGDKGTVGQVLTSTGTGTDWETPFSTTAAEIYRSTTSTSNLGTGFGNITMNSTGIIDPDYMTSTTSITVSNTGRYRITFRVTATVINNTRSGAEFRLTRNGGQIPGTIAATYNRNIDADQNTVTIVKVIDLTTTDIIRAQGRRYTNNGNIRIIANGTSLLVERIK